MKYYTSLIIVGLTMSIGGVWFSAWTMHIIEGWGTVPSFITGCIFLIGGLILVFYASMKISDHNDK